MAKSKELDEKILATEKDAESVLRQLEALVSKIGNLVHESVTISQNEADNKIIKTWGTLPDNKITELSGKPGRAHHHEILTMIDGIEQARGINLCI